eukprot:595396-Rhodomonas_salina.1
MRPEKGWEQIHVGENTDLREKEKDKKRGGSLMQIKERKEEIKEESSRVGDTPRHASALNMSGWVGGQNLYLEALTSCMLLTEKTWFSGRVSREKGQDEVS